MQRYRSNKHQGVGHESVPTVEAVQLTKENVAEVAEWCTGQEVREIDSLDPHRTYVALNFIAWDGVTRASEGDYIVKDGLGEFHLRWADNFERDFSEVEDG